MNISKNDHPYWAPNSIELDLQCTSQKGLTPEDMDQINRDCPNLESLTVRSLHGSDACIARLGAFGHLSSLELYDSDVQGATLQNLPHTMRTLSFHHCNSIVQDRLSRISDIGITKLRLDNCHTEGPINFWVANSSIINCSCSGNGSISQSFANQYLDDDHDHEEKKVAMTDEELAPTIAQQEEHAQEEILATLEHFHKNRHQQKKPPEDEPERIQYHVRKRIRRHNNTPVDQIPPPPTYDVPSAPYLPQAEPPKYEAPDAIHPLQKAQPEHALLAAIGTQIPAVCAYVLVSNVYDDKTIDSEAARKTMRTLALLKLIQHARRMKEGYDFINFTVGITDNGILGSLYSLCLEYQLLCGSEKAVIEDLILGKNIAATEAMGTFVEALENLSGKLRQ